MITASNLEEPLQDATLRVRLLSSDGQVVKEQEISHLHLEGSGCVSQLGSLETRGLRPSLYCAELTLYSQQDVEVARSLELFYLEEQRAEEQPVK